MSNPLHTLGYRMLKASLEGGNPERGHPLKLSRRGFMLLAASLSSCSAAPALGVIPGKTTSNLNYRTPSLLGPVPRNPDLAFGADFSNNAGVSFSRVMVAGNYIAMTFDDGPHPQNTPRLLNILRARNIKATFFVIGSCVDLYPQVVRRCVAEGHEIGNHSYSHRLLSKLSDSEISLELARCRDAIVAATGVPPRVMRPPYGGLLQRQRERVHAEFGYPTILWSVDPLDWKRPGPSVVTSRILHSTTPGAIILSHDLHSPTVDAMPATLDTLLRRGFQFVTVSQLLAMKSNAASAQAAVTRENS
jgi:peptidoglycan/xylan/chitin deacetylase (PgdA/CDA1 family)